jgi:hypothetical protein
METLELHYNQIRNEWYLRDTRGNHLGTMNARGDAERYATEMGYRLRIHSGSKLEWFTPKAQ